MRDGMRSLPLLLSLALLSYLPAAQASTPLFSFEGSAAPNTQGWTSGGTTNVIGSTYNDNGTSVWRIYDPGTAAVPGTLSNLTYAATLGAALKDSVMSSGWELSATIKVPEADPTTGEAWGNGSNTWVGFIANNAATGNRQLWALQWGRDAQGNTLLSSYGVSGTLVLTPGYHDYSIVYDPLTALATISVDGEVWRSTYAGGPIAGTGTNQVYWGDNNSQPSAQPARSAYYAAVNFAVTTTTVPEPSRLVLLLAAGCIWVTYRKRKEPR